MDEPIGGRWDGCTEVDSKASSWRVFLEGAARGIGDGTYSIPRPWQTRPSAALYDSKQLLMLALSFGYSTISHKTQESSTLIAHMKCIFCCKMSEEILKIICF